MSANCRSSIRGVRDSRYRCVLWVVLAINAVMFVVEIAAGAFRG